MEKLSQDGKEFGIQKEEVIAGLELLLQDIMPKQELSPEEKAVLEDPDNKANKTWGSPKYRAGEKAKDIECRDYVARSIAEGNPEALVLMSKTGELRDFLEKTDFNYKENEGFDKDEEFQENVGTSVTMLDDIGKALYKFDSRFLEGFKSNNYFKIIQIFRDFCTKLLKQKHLNEDVVITAPFPEDRFDLDNMVTTEDSSQNRIYVKEPRSWAIRGVNKDGESITRVWAEVKTV